MVEKNVDIFRLFDELYCFILVFRDFQFYEITAFNTKIEIEYGFFVCFVICPSINVNRA